jgi:hypothetical protein
MLNESKQDSDIGLTSLELLLAEEVLVDVID